MNGFDVVLVIAIILFARLGIRLVSGYKRLKKEKDDEDSKSKNDESDSS
ncbi:MAG: hypothetical protein HKP42_06065 [Maribacter sp.]|nr:hypothetical protein [Maribacter sp.]